MNGCIKFRCCAGSFLATVVLATALAAPAAAIPTFISFNQRLPNPDQPYVMPSGNFGFDNVFIAGLSISPTNPSQLDIPSRDMDGNWAFDSIFDFQYSAFVGIGLGPAVPVSGVGAARAVGVVPNSADRPIFDPLVYQTEMVALSLTGNLPGGATFLLRESPALQSTGVTTVEDLCVPCGAPVSPLRISSFFDVFTELSVDGGATWVPAPNSIRLLQTPEPAIASLVLCAMGFVVSGRRRKSHTRMSP